MTKPQHKIPSPGNEIYNFIGPSLGHYYYTLNLSDLCLGVEKMIFKEIMYAHNISYMVFLSHHYHALRLSESCPRV